MYHLCSSLLLSNPTGHKEFETFSLMRWPFL
jgi:hypothetical protein